MRLVIDRRAVLDTFRERLDAVVRRSGLGRGGFAEHLQIDRSTMSQLLSPANRRLPRAETLVEIASSQQVSIDWLLGLSNAGPMQAEMLQEQTSFAVDALAPNDERLIGWFEESAWLQDPLRPVDDPRSVEVRAAHPLRARPLRRVSTRAEDRDRCSAARVDPQPRHRPRDVHQRAVGRVVRSRRAHLARPGRGAATAQMEHMIELTSELYPSLRWFLFDGLQRFAAPVTIFGPQRAALYLGQMYLVLTSTEHVRTLTTHFDDLVRGAVVHLHEMVTTSPNSSERPAASAADPPRPARVSGPDRPSEEWLPCRHGGRGSRLRDRRAARSLASGARRWRGADRRGETPAAAGAARGRSPHASQRRLARDPAVGRRRTSRRRRDHRARARQPPPAIERGADRRHPPGRLPARPERRTRRRRDGVAGTAGHGRPRPARSTSALDAWAGALGRWRGSRSPSSTGPTSSTASLDRCTSAGSTSCSRSPTPWAATDSVHGPLRRSSCCCPSYATSRCGPNWCGGWPLLGAVRFETRRRSTHSTASRSRSAGSTSCRDVREAIAADDPPATWVWERDVPAGAAGLAPCRPGTPRPMQRRTSSSRPTAARSKYPTRRPQPATPAPALAGGRVRHRVALVCGPAGIGKSRLLHELAAVTAPGHVAYGRFEPDVRTPLRALRQALRWRDVAGDDAEPGEDGAAHTERVVAAAAERIAGVARTRRGLVLMVDDLHDADSLSLLTLVELVVQHPTAPVTLVCTVRDAGRSMPLVRRLADRARRDDRFDEVNLDGLDVTDVEVLLAATAPDQASNANAVRDVTGGNPYLVRLLATSLQHGHELPVAIEHTSDAIGDLVDHQIGELGDDDLDVLRLAAAAGRTVRLEGDRAVHRVGHRVVARDDRATDARAAPAEDPGPVDRFTFAHELLRSYVLQATPASTRRRLHGRIAAAFEALAGDLEVTSAELADQWSKSHRTSRSARHFLDAARHAATRGAHAEALAAAESGLAFCEQDEALEAELQMAAAAALHDLGRLRGRRAGARRLGARSTRRPRRRAHTGGSADRREVRGEPLRRRPRRDAAVGAGRRDRPPVAVAVVEPTGDGGAEHRPALLRVDRRGAPPRRRRR
ncbi:MAG: AAA family ATPase [Ilumatobacteraceae bacterium]